MPPKATKSALQKPKAGRTKSYLESIPRGGYGRPPAAWLAHENLKKLENAGNEMLTYRQIAEVTGESKETVQRLCRRYHPFLWLKHLPDHRDEYQLALVRPKRLRLLHLVLLRDYELRVQLRPAKDGRKNQLPSAFAYFLSAARSAGYKGDGIEDGPLLRNPAIIEENCMGIRAALGIDFLDLSVRLEIPQPKVKKSLKSYP
ncbi:MAG: hypothetical protein M3Q07_15715 [Pseudobdellovibrionaceae bacterium]|nr:hypothetical protein [Pseudobdellovibrionaceae bacterium]